MIAIGQIVGERYEIKRQLGKGSFATVYLAFDRELERQVAVKVISVSGAEDSSQFLQAFLTEAKLVAKLTHPNILDVYSYGQDGDEAYLVIPYASGGTLSDRLKRGRLPIELSIRLLRQMVEGLAYAHKLDIIHRDLKPQNMLLLGDQERLVIADFGLARVLPQTTGLYSTRVTGTPFYMAPEQWEGHAGKPSDVFALGIILYQMLSGEIPFSDGNISKLYERHLKEEITPLIQKRPEAGEGLSKLIQVMTAKDPSTRPRVADLSQLLDEALQNQPPLLENPANLEIDPNQQTQSTHPLILQNQLSNPAAKKPRRNWLVLGAVGLVVLLLVAVITVLQRGNQETSGPTYLDAPTTPLAQSFSGGGPGAKVRTFKTTSGAKNLRADSSGNIIQIAKPGLTGLTREYSYWDTNYGTPRSRLAEFASPPLGQNFSYLYLDDQDRGKYIVKSYAYTPPGTDTGKVDFNQPETLEFLELNSGKVVLKVDDVVPPPDDTFLFTHLFFGADRNWAAVSITGGKLRFYDLAANGKLLGELDTGGEDKVITSYTSDANFITLYTPGKEESNEPKYFTYDLRNLKTGGLLPNRSPVISNSHPIQLATDGSRVMYGNEKGELKLFSLPDLKPITTVPFPTDNTLTRAYFFNGRYILTGEGPVDNETYFLYRNEPDNQNIKRYKLFDRSGLDANVYLSGYYLNYSDDTVFIPNFSNRSDASVEKGTTQKRLKVYNAKQNTLFFDGTAEELLGTYEAGNLEIILEKTSSEGNGTLAFYDMTSGERVGQVVEPVPQISNVNNNMVSLSDRAAILEKKGLLAVLFTDGTVNFYNLKR